MDNPTEITYQRLLPEFVAGTLLTKFKLKIATAESCTGGLVGHRLTNVAGSSAYFWGGILSYDNSVKQQVLGVSEQILNTVGAVSAECALAMADGARRVIGSQLGLSTTGIAGPSGSTAGKPVGLVYIALTSVDGFRRCEHYIWDADRIANKEQSAEAALRMLVEYLQTL
jgi:PncC family amidohydrolase